MKASNPRLIFLLVCLLMNFSKSWCQQLTVQELIHLNIQALGGHQALQGLQSVSRKGHIEFSYPSGQGPRGLYNYRTDIVYPLKVRERIHNRDHNLLERGSDGNQFWSWKNGSYQKINDQMEQNYLKVTAQRANRSVLWIEEEFQNLRLSENPPWMPQGKCITGESEGKKTYFCFDKKTGLLLAKGNMSEYRLFKDWKKRGEVYFPFSITHYLKNQQVYQVTLISIEINQQIPEQSFQYPSI